MIQDLKNEISHSEENIPERTSDLDTGEHHPRDTEMATRIDPARIEPGQIITYNHMDTWTLEQEYQQRC